MAALGVLGMRPALATKAGAMAHVGDLKNNLLNKSYRDSRAGTVFQFGIRFV